MNVVRKVGDVEIAAGPRGGYVVKGGATPVAIGVQDSFRRLEDAVERATVLWNGVLLSSLIQRASRLPNAGADTTELLTRALEALESEVK